VAVAAATSLSGTWKETMHPSTALGGTWTFKATSSKYTVSDTGQFVDRGKYSIKGNKVSFNDTGGPAKCPGTGVYKFKLKGNKLKFTLVSDKNAACAGRRGVLTAGTFKKAA
jgi:Lipocalin-like domain